MSLKPLVLIEVFRALELLCEDEPARQVRIEALESAVRDISRRRINGLPRLRGG
jgi:hypothetical protein